MRKKGWGRIINVSSIYGIRATVNRVGYVTTKTALIGLTRAVALETAGQDITCNAVCPGTALTPIHEAAIQGLMSTEHISFADAERRILAGKQPTARLIPASNVAALVVFLCSPEAADVTGAVLPIDGGWSAS
jgi:3-hydroxybutyrate dehydrogenase